MTLSLVESLDRTLTLSRLPEGISSGVAWGGDQDDVYIATDSGIPCRMEVTDIETYTVWLMDDIMPVSGDRVSISGMNATLVVIRVQPWTDSHGAFHHYELTVKPVYPTRELVDAR